MPVLVTGLCWYCCCRDWGWCAGCGAKRHHKEVAKGPAAESRASWRCVLSTFLFDAHPIILGVMTTFGPTMKLRIATYNIHKGVSTLAREPRVHALRAAIHDLQADLVFLQEVQGRHDRHQQRFGHSTLGQRHWPQQAQHEFLAGERLHAAYGKNAIYREGHHGNALLSAFPILSALNNDVSDHAFEQRGVLHCVLQTPLMPLHCFVVHFGLFAGSRQRQTEALIEVVRQHAGTDAPLIIAGDFNDWRNHLGDTLREQLGVIEVFDERRSTPRLGSLWRNLAGRTNVQRFVPARTFPAALPWLRLDRIYCRGFIVEQAQVLRGQPWAQLSDHAPILAELRWHP